MYEAAVWRRVAPRQEWLDYNKRLAELTRSVFVDLSHVRDDSYQVIEDDVAEWDSLFNGNRRSGRIQHFCSKSRADRTPCCGSPEETRRRMKRAVRGRSAFLWGKLCNGTKKWCEAARAGEQLPGLGETHMMLNSGSCPWRKRRRSADTSSVEHIDDDQHTRKRKREKKAGQLAGQSGRSTS